MNDTTKEDGATIGTLMVSPYREISPHMDTAAINGLLDELAAQIDKAIADARAIPAELTARVAHFETRIDDVEGRATRAEQLAAAYHDSWTAALEENGVLKAAAKAATEDLPAMRALLADLTEENATLRGYVSRVHNEDDANDKMVEVPGLSTYVPQSRLARDGARDRGGPDGTRSFRELLQGVARYGGRDTGPPRPAWWDLGQGRRR